MATIVNDLDNQPLTTVIDGLIVDIETGDVLGLAEKEEFRVTDQDSAEWVLERRLNAQTELARLAIKEKAVLERIGVEKRTAQRRIEFLDARFGPELAEFAQRELDNINAGKPESKWKKSINLVFGKLGFRTSGGGLKVKNESACIQIAELDQSVIPADCVRTETRFLISLLPKDKKAEIEESIRQSQLDEKDLLLQAFEVAEPETKFYVDGGVK